MKMKLPLIAAGALALVLGAGPASAELVTVEVTGTVDFVNDPTGALAGEVQTGGTVTGRYTYDTAVPDNDPNPEYGRYEQDPSQLALRLEIGNLVFATNETPTSSAFAAVDVMNSTYGDSFHVGAGANFQPLASGATVQHVDFDFFDPTGTALTTDALLTTAPQVAGFADPMVFVAGNDASGNWYDFRVRITSAQLAGDAAPEGTYNLSAEIVDVYDPAGALGTGPTVGTVLTGTYFIDTQVPDLEPSDPMWGRYEQPATTGYGFSLQGGGITLASDATVPGRPVMVEVVDGYYDEFHILTAGQATVVAGSTVNVDFIDMWLIANHGQVWSSDALMPDAPPLASFDGYQDLVIGGMGPTGDYWHILARVTAITKAGSAVQKPSLVSPPTGFYFRDQDIRVMFKLQAGKQFSHVTGIIDGQPVGAFEGSCHPIPLQQPGREVALCGDLNYLLPGGSHNLTWTVHYMDGSSDTESVEWEMIE